MKALDSQLQYRADTALVAYYFPGNLLKLKTYNVYHAEKYRTPSWAAFPQRVDMSVLDTAMPYLTFEHGRCSKVTLKHEM